MDLPPLFPYATRPDWATQQPHYFEDGGVVDNLPISLGTQFEECDLLFVLPLSASYDGEVNRTSILRRLFLGDGRAARGDRAPRLQAGLPVQRVRGPAEGRSRGRRVAPPGASVAPPVAGLGAGAPAQAARDLRHLSRLAVRDRDGRVLEARRGRGRVRADVCRHRKRAAGQFRGRHGPHQLGSHGHRGAGREQPLRGRLLAPPAPGLRGCEASHSTNTPGRNRTCNPRFWSALPATPALQRLLIFNELALSHQRRRCWTTPALTLILALTSR